MIEYATQILRIQHKDKLLDITIQMFTGRLGQVCEKIIIETENHR